jgi:speckle-type POZ protein
MERLKLICGDMLCSCIDATTAVATRELAEKHGCLKLKEACIKVIRDWLAKVTP